MPAFFFHLTSFPAMRVPKWRRTTTGCLTCRMRRKKCDEQKPECVGCHRNRLICKWSDESTESDMTALARLSKQNRPATESTHEVNFDQNLPVPAEPWHGYKWHPRNSMIRSFEGIQDIDSHLFHHYMQVSAIQLAGRVEPENPFLSHLIPMAYEHTAVLRCILAVSGAQLLATSAKYESDTRSHHAVSLRSTKHALVNWRKASTTDLVALLTSTLLLCFFEAVVGDVRGNFHYHLKASRVILYELRVKSAAKVDNCFLDLLTEFYAFFAITTNITLHADLKPDRTIPQDTFLCSDILGSLNRGTGIYGVLFGAAHELFASINPIAHSARNSLAKKDNAQKLHQISSYEAQIKAWRYDRRISSHFEPDTIDSYELAARIYQQAVLIYLYTMFHGASHPTLDLYAKVEPCLHVALGAMGAMPQHAPIQTTFLWPVLITGSCLRDDGLRKAVLEGFQSVSYTMLSVKRSFEFLKLLWKEMDLNSAVYGPWGIEQVMIKYGIDLCCA